MRFYEATSDIDASPETVWSVLTDGASWSRWDSGVDGVEGKIAGGEKIKIRSKAAPGRAFPVKITTFEPGRRMIFTGGMPLGLFKGVRTYTLSPSTAGGTTFRMREEYSGPLLPLIGRSIPDLGPSFEQFAGGLKQRVESGAP